MSSSSPSLPQPWSMQTIPPATLAPSAWTSEGKRCKKEGTDGTMDGQMGGLERMS